MPSSFIDSERGKGLCCSLGPLPLPSLHPLHLPGQVGEGLCHQQGPSSPCSPWDGDGAGTAPARHRPCQGVRGSRQPRLPMGRLAAERTGAEQTCGSPNSSDLRKGKITNIFHFKLELNLEVLWLQDASFPTLSWSNLQIPPLSLLVKT